MKELLEFIVRSIVDNPDAVEVDEAREDDGTVVLELSVAEDDYGKIIGRGGRTARALRGVMRAVAVREECRVVLEIVE